MNLMSVMKRLSTFRPILPALHSLCILMLSLAVLGCDNSSKPSNETSSGGKGASNVTSTEKGGANDTCAELLNSLFNVYRIDRFESTFDLTIGVNRMNDWYRSCSASQVRQVNGNLPDGVKSVLSGAQQALLTGDQYRVRDASHLRDCVLFSSIASRINLATSVNNQGDLARAQRAFDHVVWATQLQARHDADLPLTPYEIMLLGRGTAVDRAWLFVNTLRALRIDAVLLSPRDSEDPGYGEESVPFLVGVPIDGEVYLFDPTLGVPVPANGSTADAIIPATLKQVVADSSLLTQFDLPEKPYALTAEMLKNPSVWLVGDLPYFSQLSQTIQQVFQGEHSILISDPLEDSDGVPGLWSRLQAAFQAQLEGNSIRLWKYPQEQIAQSLALDNSRQEVRKGLKLRFMAYLVAVPHPENPQIVIVTGSREMTDPAQKGLDNKDRNIGGFSRTESKATSGRQMEARLSHLAGDLPGAVKAYVEVQSGAREILALNDSRIMIDPRLAQINVKLFHAKAIDDAVFWSALCQLELGQIGPSASTFERYLRNANTVSEWKRQAIRMRATALAQQKKYKQAAEVLEKFPEDHPETAGIAYLRRLWGTSAEADSQE